MTRLIQGNISARMVELTTLLNGYFDELGSHPFVLKGAVNNGQTTYSPSSNVLGIGGVNTVATGLPGGTVLTSLTLRIKALRDGFTTIPANFAISVFDASPAGTFADNVAWAAVAGDVAKCLLGTAAGITNNVAGGVAFFTLTLTRLTLDGSGSFYFAVGTGVNTVFTATNVLSYEADGTY